MHIAYVKQISWIFISVVILSVLVSSVVDCIEPFKGTDSFFSSEGPQGLQGKIPKRGISYLIR
jgi:hypothetical protein